MRQFIAERNPDERGFLCLSPESVKYLRRVLRLGEGERVPVRFPDERLEEMVLTRGETGEWRLRGACFKNETPESGGSAIFDCVDFAVLQFLPKIVRMDTIVRQMTECGARYIMPVEGEYSPEGDAAKRGLRWRKIIREARQQSASPVPTELLEPLAPSQALLHLASLEAVKTGRALLILLHETRGNVTLGELVKKKRDLRLAVIAVGSEGGMSDREIRAFAGAGFEQVHFQTNILRVDTAALYGMAALQSALMEANK